MADIKLNIGLNNGEKLSLGKKELLSIETLSQSTGQPKEIFYGVTPSSGNAEINDVFGNIAKSITDGTIPNSNMPIEIMANGNYVNFQITTDSDYSNTQKKFSIQFTDELSKWDSLQYIGLALNTDNNGTPIESNAYEMLLSVFSYFDMQSQVDDMLDTQIGYGNGKIGTVKQYLQNINIPVPYIESGNLRDVIEKFCLLSQLNVIQNDNGKIKFVQSRPIRVNDEPIIVIPPKNQFSSIEKNIIIKNKYDGVEAITKKPNLELNINTNVHTYKQNDVISDFADAAVQTYNCTKFNGSGALAHTYYNAIYVSIDNIEYTSGTIIIPQKSKNGINNIIEINQGYDKNGERNIKCKIIGDRYYGSAQATANGSDLTSDISYTELIKEQEISKDLSQEQLTISRTHEEQGYTTVTATISKFNASNLGSLTITKEQENYKIEYKILVKRRFTAIKGHIKLDSNFTPTISLSGTPDGTENFYGYEEFEAKSFELSFYGDTRVISFENIAKESGKGNNVVRFGENILLQDGTSLTMGTHYEPFFNLSTAITLPSIYVTNTYSFDSATGKFVNVGDYFIINHLNVYDYIGQTFYSFSSSDGIFEYKNIQPSSITNRISYNRTFVTSKKVVVTEPQCDIIKNNILTDYAEGIETARVSVSCSDYYDTKGFQQKKWGNGDIFQVGDIVRLDKDSRGNSAFNYSDGTPKIWKVTGRKFRNGGLPFVDLELQENKIIT